MWWLARRSSRKTHTKFAYTLILQFDTQLVEATESNCKYGGYCFRKIRPIKRTLRIRMKLLVTGGNGFIGSAVVRDCILERDWTIINIDALTQVATLGSVEVVSKNQNYHFHHMNILDRAALDNVFKSGKPDAVIHLAAESHVDRSIDGPMAFIQTNVVGTVNFLEAARNYFETLNEDKKKSFRFLHVSTDEVFGSLSLEGGKFTETSPYAPSSPYSASKAASDHLVVAFGHTYGLPVLLTNCSNNYGPFHFPEKLVPLMIIKAMRNLPLQYMARALMCEIGCLWKIMRAHWCAY